MSSIEEEEVQVTMMEQASNMFWYVIDIIPFEMSLYLVPLAILALVSFFIYQAVMYYLSLYVQGEPDEWVLIIRDNQLIESGVGLATIRGPFDTVARFPSKVQKIQFSAQQVTKEMQGIEVYCMMVWQVYREGDGPFRALKSLGKDLQTGDPRTANKNLINIASAIVRNQIANATIEQVLTDRAFMRDAIRNEMGKLVQGWGVWLETVEITDVKILSGSLFRNLQTEFRENNRMEASVTKLEADTAINHERKLKELESSKRDIDTQDKQNTFQNARKITMAQETQKRYEKECQLEQKKVEQANSVEMFKYNTSVKQQENAKKAEFDTELKSYDRKVTMEESLRKKYMAKADIDFENFVAQLKQESTKSDNEREIKKATVDQLKSVIDKDLLDHTRQEAIDNIYKSLSVNKRSVVNVGQDDAAVKMLDAYLKQ